MSEFGDLIPEFVEESLEHLKDIEEDIIIIEQGSADSELINRVFRAVHSIKGGSSFLGLKNIERLSHKMEDIFNLVRNKELEFTSEVSSRVLKSIDTLKEMLEDSEESDSYDIAENLKELKQCLGKKPPSPAAVKMEKKPGPTETLDDTSLKIDKKSLAFLRAKGKKIYLIQFEFKEESLDGKNPMDFFAEIEKTGELLLRDVDMELVLKDESFTGEGIPMSVLYATVLEKDLVAHIFGIEEAVVKEVKPGSSLEEEVLAAARVKKEGKAGDSFPGRKPTPREAPEDREAPLVRTKKEKMEIPGVDEDNETIIRTGSETKEAEEGDETAGSIEDTIEEEFMEIDEEKEEDPDTIKDMNEFLTFWVGDEEYGIGITQVHEIVTLLEFTPVPSAEEFTRGVINLRGDIIPVFDFRMRLKFEERPYDHESVILIVVVNGKKVGVIVDRVSEVLQLAKNEITDAPLMQHIPADFVIGIGQKVGKFIILLKLKEIFYIQEAVKPI